ncbi:3-hydroxybutyryl-CoA dehydrogenase [Stygiobacter electus]|uniref:3-hydroxybutyryl-CoA dehydrogenase n=1 Tax=Stygiobacter electus TaxID=3032292 RepID=A0AAE3P240_9BACT|nr:3-hydroxybutyryl-CoA dehydrogenase [Stygiobacter electus]MDF1611425.1 3-hydroxybutyryl-CoA dehydrogenase [Stygiobacter electus]
MQIEKIAVIGSGTMGNGIAHVFALNNFNTLLIDNNLQALEKAKNTINLNLDRQIKKGVISNEIKNKTLNNLSFLTSLDDNVSECDLIIEAIFENKEAKIKVYEQLLKIMKKEFILASNTSSISITELAPREIQSKFIGMHFMNPVPVMELVEIIKGYSTSESTHEIIFNLTKKIGKTPVTVNDYPGFISNRVLLPMINEAIFALYEGVATKEDIDKVMKLGMNHPMGPLTLADFIGLDVCLNIIDVLYKGFNDSKYRACPLLRNMVNAGKLGRKTGEGFYKY